MAGHSHSANIARRKGAVDAQRARAFNKCARALQSAVRQGGPDAASNLKLRYALEKARAANMPKENIERVIKRAAGEGAGNIEDLIYEGYAPGGVALMVACLTDNRHRTSADLKHIFERRGGNLGSPGSVGFLFELRSILVVERGGRSEDELLGLALEIGADDVAIEEQAAVFHGQPGAFLGLKSALEARGLSCVSAQLGYLPLNSVPVRTREDASRVLKLIEDLEENDDVQDVYANYDMPPEWIEELSSGAPG